MATEWEADTVSSISTANIPDSPQYTTVDAAGNLHRVTPHVVNNGYVATTPSRPMMPLW